MQTLIFIVLTTAFVSWGLYNSDAISGSVHDTFTYSQKSKFHMWSKLCYNGEWDKSADVYEDLGDDFWEKYYGMSNSRKAKLDEVSKLSSISNGLMLNMPGRMVVGNHLAGRGAVEQESTIQSVGDMSYWYRKRVILLKPSELEILVMGGRKTVEELTLYICNGQDLNIIHGIFESGFRLPAETIARSVIHGAEIRMRGGKILSVIPLNIYGQG